MVKVAPNTPSPPESAPDIAPTPPPLLPNPALDAAVQRLRRGVDIVVENDLQITPDIADKLVEEIRKKPASQSQINLYVQTAARFQNAEALARIMRGLPSNVETVVLSDGSVRSDQISELAAWVKAKPGIARLFLVGDNLGDDSAKTLAQQDWGAHLKLLSVGGNHIGRNGASALADMLKRNPNLQLVMQGNPISPQEAKEIFLDQGIAKDRIFGLEWPEVAAPAPPPPVAPTPPTKLKVQLSVGNDANGGRLTLNFPAGVERAITNANGQVTVKLIGGNAEFETPTVLPHNLKAATVAPDRTELELVLGPGARYTSVGQITGQTNGGDMVALLFDNPAPAPSPPPVVVPPPAAAATPSPAPSIAPVPPARPPVTASPPPAAPASTPVAASEPAASSPPRTGSKLPPRVHSSEHRVAATSPSTPKSAHGRPSLKSVLHQMADIPVLNMSHQQMYDLHDGRRVAINTESGQVSLVSEKVDRLTPLDPQKDAATIASVQAAEIQRQKTAPVVTGKDGHTQYRKTPDGHYEQATAATGAGWQTNAASLGIKP